MNYFSCAIALLIISSGSILGCEMISTKGGPSADETRPLLSNNGETGEAWPFVPVRARWHAFTEIRYTEEGRPFIAGTVELLDQQADPVKGVGEFRFELYRIATLASDAQRDQLQTWAVPLLTLEQNATHYDKITRAYNFQLAIANPIEPGDKLRAELAFTDPYGRRMTHTIDLTVPEK